MTKTCDICGREQDAYWMDCYNTGRTRIWICPACKRKGIREVDLSEVMNKKRKRKENEKR